MLKALHDRNADKTSKELRKLQEVAIRNGNLFEALMTTCKTCSLGEITHALFEVGGQYRRNM
jgi:methylmalonyl-CoA mutase